jgi:hypothetical protein
MNSTFTSHSPMIFTCHITLLSSYKTSGESFSFSSDILKNICLPELNLKHLGTVSLSCAIKKFKTHDKGEPKEQHTFNSAFRQGKVTQ